MAIDIRRVICGPLEENCYIVQGAGREDCVVVDPGDDYSKIKAALGVRSVAAVLLTHGHFDHIMAAGALSEAFGAPVYVGAEDDEMLNDAEKSGYAGMMGVPRADWPPISAQPYEGRGDAVQRRHAVPGGLRTAGPPRRQRGRHAEVAENGVRPAAGDPGLARPRR